MNNLIAFLILSFTQGFLVASGVYFWMINEAPLFVTILMVSIVVVATTHILHSHKIKMEV